ncbi:Zinc finger, RING-type [Sesbania bispinosa]|nr:Zinc finger, RING-type [Sesbania bispinosa]
MGFPVGYTELMLPKVFVQLLSVLGFIRKLVTILLCYLGLEPDDIAWPERMPEFESVSALLMGEILPVVKFSEVEMVDPQERCAVCLYDFEAEDEIRRLTNCRHIFHRGCLDRWMGYDRRTCPLCRTPFIPHHMQDTFNEIDTLWEASGIPDFYDDHPSTITPF